MRLVHAKIDAVAARVDAVRARMDAFDEGSHPRAPDGKFGSGRAGTLATKLKAPIYTTVHESGGKHGGGTVGWAETITHGDAHKNMIGAGFKKSVRSTNNTVHTKMGRSAAYSQSKVQKSEYEHPEGHTGSVKTSTPKYGSQEPSSHFDINLKPAS